MFLVRVAHHAHSITIISCGCVGHQLLNQLDTVAGQVAQTATWHKIAFEQSSTKMFAYPCRVLLLGHCSRTYLIWKAFITIIEKPTGLRMFITGPIYSCAFHDHKRYAKCLSHSFNSVNDLVVGWNIRDSGSMSVTLTVAAISFDARWDHICTLQRPQKFILDLSLFRHKSQY